VVIKNTQTEKTTATQLAAWEIAQDNASKIKSDGCSGPGIDWLVRLFIPCIRSCCITHDWVLFKNRLPRGDADALLRECIESKASGPWSRWWFWLVALVFYITIRLRSRLGSISSVYSFLWVLAIIVFVIYKTIQ
jgi:hypothetical protein